MNSVYIDSATPATPIYIGPNNTSSIIIGNANCSTSINGTLAFNSVAPSGSTTSSPYLGSYYTVATTTYNPTANGQNLGVINIGSTGIFLVNIYVELKLSSSTSPNACVAGASSVYSTGFSTIYGSGPYYQSANVIYTVRVTTAPYTNQITLGGAFTVSAIAANGISFLYSVTRIG